LTNLAFIIASLFGWRLAAWRKRLSGEIKLLLALAAAIGVGSFLFHTLATEATKWLDLLPIFLYQLWFLWIYARRFLHWRPDTASAFVVSFFCIMLAAQFLPTRWLNGSLSYAPAFVVLLCLGIHHYQTARQERWLLLAAVACFSIALVFRSIDTAVCEQFPLGTHFLWHLCNGGLIYLTLRAAILDKLVTT
ncbi:MAG TPA: ceramidase domain-containing protein, partial [Pirellulaceae bacterium]|nr:ceramidase domain-containing protein [Pirellulaceae bacterium]